MQRLPKRLVDGAQLTAAAATYFTVPANSLCTISAMSVTNTTATPRLLVTVGRGYRLDAAPERRLAGAA